MGKRKLTAIATGGVSESFRAAGKGLDKSFPKPKVPGPTAEELAAERRARTATDRSIIAKNRRLKAASRSAGSRAALLSGNFLSGSSPTPALGGRSSVNARILSGASNPRKQS